MMARCPWRLLTGDADVALRLADPGLLSGYAVMVVFDTSIG